MPRLLVMRHAKSDWSTGAADFDRPLSPRGHADAPRMAQWLEDEGLVPDAVLSSAANRARTTARYVAEHFAIADDAVEELTELYHADAGTWLEILQGQTAADLLVCGHNPVLDDLVVHLAGEPPETTSSGKLMTTAAIAVFAVEDWPSLSPATCRFERLVRPRQLR